MRLSNGEVLLHWPLDLHVLTQGWYYNDGSLHQGADWRTQNGTDYKRPVYAAEEPDAELGRSHKDWNAELWQHGENQTRALQGKDLADAIRPFEQLLRQGRPEGQRGRTHRLFWR